MRKTVLLSAQSIDCYRVFDETHRHLLEDTFFLGAEETGYFVSNEKAQGYYAVHIRETFPIFSLYFTKDVCFEDACGYISFLSEKWIRQKHPAKILCMRNDALIHVFHACGFYQKGTYYQKKIEPYRYILSDSVFDEEGYIINQGMMNKVPFGWFTTDRKGCGWIAAYNLLKMCGHEQSMQETAECLGKMAILGAVAGESLHMLYLYLRTKGINCGLSLPLDVDAKAKMKNSKYGILLYVHHQGAHYVAYRNIGGDKMLFYNAIYGKRNHIETIDDFLEERELLPFSSVIYIN